MEIKASHPPLKKLLAYKILKHIQNYWGHFLGLHRVLILGLFEVIQAHYWDKKFGVETWESCDIDDKHSLYQDGQEYVPTPLRLLQKITDSVELKESDVFLDFGCGKGRVVLFMSLQKVKRIVGVELNKDLFDIAKRNVAHFKVSRTPVDLVNDDVVNYRITDENIFFFYHPFGRETFQEVIRHIKDSWVGNPRIRIIYYSPAYQDFLDRQDWLVFEKRVENEDCMIWRSRSSELAR